MRMLWRRLHDDRQGPLRLRDAPLQRHLLECPSHQSRQVEARILSGLKERLMAPELVEAFVDQFNAEIRRSPQVSETKRATLKRALTDIDRKIAGIMRAIEDGNYNPTLTARLSALEADKTKAETNLANAAVPAKLRIHPNLPALYRRKIEQLQEALTPPATQVEAGEIIRSLIGRIELTPAGGTLAVKLYGDPAQIMAFSETDKQKDPVSREAGPILSVVAARGVEPRPSGYETERQMHNQLTLHEQWRSRGSMC
jgi:site-specific DNA recombinase